eukprot:Sspe_Gene.53158::Locus_29409_Transcript_1_1_Confidence_1.000_Length_1015::g.53158::m.53158/K00901/dgkA, DGK; diacylglycerol kinase (ATP)
MVYVLYIPDGYDLWKIFVTFFALWFIHRFALLSYCFPDETAQSPRAGLHELLHKSKHGTLVLPDNLTHLIQRRPSSPTGRLKTLLGVHKGAPEPDALPVAIPEGLRPVLAFVNSRSGGGQGREIILRLRRLLNPTQVVDLAAEDPASAFRRFRAIPRLRILVCGGDGTVGWVLSALKAVCDSLPDDLSKDRVYRPPTAVMPLGTGNDLARVLGWGGGWEGDEISNVLAQ